MTEIHTMPIAEPVLEVRGLSAGYGKRAVVHDVDLTVRAGEIRVLLGHNGAGKTTLVRSVFGLLRPSAGTVRYRGEDITRRRCADNVKAGIALVPQGHGIFRSLTVRENLELGAYTAQDPAEIRANRDAVMDLFPILRERAGQIAGTMSGGQQQMLAMGMALMHRPDVMILDEPSIGLAPNLVQRVMEAIAEVNRALRMAVLMVEQNVVHALPIAQSVTVLRTGRKIYEGPPEPLGDRQYLMTLF
ncbi:ABC transporter ATP-binding protein (plasmid) [Azospirillum baldaniorum]|uniref:High-affinity branched-chain amino acid transport protein (ABC superfamily, ATP-binding) n=1 Tax=Azospirillum baldaniorum TaxID=1064539 RepID=A0A9P1JYT5_9PROT|nr:MULTISPECIES: ABC transporter ATP-binding protein [Azospirillum]AWJ93042.1 ABC transporter ATP-binding protein [Azospirillum baldaniorum]TWA76192.1 amino acid/amide ABC transporter ATP-binding protein 2 (HAAT family) [Azospirillum brasilense]CCD02371.1 high-affinity branched-chain amino acid transport protein (ABC superfamily, ATP-binding) [Azospirillum baldaniorum]